MIAMIRNKENGSEANPETDARIFELQAQICQTLANPKKLQIISFLKEGERSVGEIVKALGVTKANVSQHLSGMRQKGILVARREGTSVYYRLADERITEACAVMREVLMNLLEQQGKLSRSMRTGER